MDLPADKSRILRAYDLHKKWELVCGQETVTERGTPAEYIEKLRTFLGDNKNKSTNKKRQMKKLLGADNSTKLLKHLEISLRTNSIE